MIKNHKANFDDHNAAKYNDIPTGNLEKKSATKTPNQTTSRQKLLQTLQYLNETAGTLIISIPLAQQKITTPFTYICNKSII